MGYIHLKNFRKSKNKEGILSFIIEYILILSKYMKKIKIRKKILKTYPTDRKN